MRNCKENEGRSLGAKKEFKSKENSWPARFHGLRDFAAKGGPCENGPWMQNYFAAKIASCEIATSVRNYFVAPRSRYENATLLRNHFAAPCPLCETTSWHTSAISQPPTLISQLRNGCEISKALKFQFSQPKPHFAGCFAAAKHPFGTRVPFRSLLPSFRSCKMVAKSPKRENSNFRSQSPILQGVS